MFEHSIGDKGILRSETHLTTEHRPEGPVERDEEVDRVAESLRPLTRRETPGNLLVYGPAGVGKTTCTRHVFDRLGEETAVKAIYINCWQYDSRSSLLTQLLIELGYPVPRKGRPVDELLSRIEEFVDKSRGVAVALDEFDKLGDQSEVVYDLQMIGHESVQGLGLVLVSNRGPEMVDIDSRSESRLSCQTLMFEPYSKSELVEILRQRVEQAFRPGVVDDEVVEMIAEEVASESGDCRGALGRLLNLGRWADRNSVDGLGVEQYQEFCGRG